MADYVKNKSWRRFPISFDGQMWCGECLWPKCGTRIVSDISETQFNWQLAEHMALNTHRHVGYAAKDRYEGTAKAVRT